MRRITWGEFRSSGMLWLVNRFLHVWGLAIVVEVDGAGQETGVYPAEVDCRGFDEASERQGYRRVTEYMARRSSELLEVFQEGSDVER